MRPYTIREFSVVLQYANGQTVTYEKKNLDAGTRTVLIGLDSLGAAGSFDELRAGLAIVNIEEPAAAPAARSGKDDNTQYQPQMLIEEPTARATPDYCEYRNGKWYCWSDAL